MLELFRLAAAFFRARVADMRREPDAGYTTETVVVVALLVAMAIAAVALISAKVIAKAGSLDLG
jgi:hypothetical protein